MTAICESRMPLVVGPLCLGFHRECSLAAFLLLAACVTPGQAPPLDGRAGGAGGDLQISLSRSTANERPILVALVTNQSSRPVCVRRDAIENPDSGEMHIELRDARGRRFRFRRGGLPPPPLEGATRIEPGASVRGYYRLDSRFRRIGGHRPFPQGVSAEASFRYNLCDGTSSFEARTAWQPI